jgi:integrase
LETTLRQPKGLTIYGIMGKEPTAKEFLDSIARNSKASQRNYAAGLLAFHKFLDGKYTLTSIIESLRKNDLDTYVILNSFVTYLLRARHRTTGQKLAPNTIEGYMRGVRSFLCFYDIEIRTNRFRRKVRMPKLYREDEEALDAADIRTIMLSCNNRRLKAFLLVLASSGLRTSEACTIRICDIDFDSSEGKPTKIHVRKEYAKTRVSRDVYISDEATKYLQEWLKWKYREKRIYGKCRKVVQGRTLKDSDLVFTHHQSLVDARAIYFKIRSEFVNLLNSVGFEKRKDGMQRRTITLYSFRRHVKTVISDQVSKDYSEWFLGHSKSPYYTMKEPMRREIYATKCMKYLTYLDYSALEKTGKSFEAKLEQKDEEIKQLKAQMRADKNDMVEFQNLMLDLKKKVEVIQREITPDLRKKAEALDKFISITNAT